MASSKWTGFYKIIQQQPTSAEVTDNQQIGSPGSYGNYNWYHKIIQGSASRLVRYREWDLMDNDIDISRALDLIAEEMIGNNTKDDDPLILEVDDISNADVTNNMVATLKAALRHWQNMHDWENRLFNLARYTVKYGDVFFRKVSGKTRWQFIHPKDVISAVVNSEDVTDIQGWQIKNHLLEAKTSYGVPSSGVGGTEETEFYQDSEIVRCTLNDDMSDNAPFGESVLRPVYRTFKQKELLEDAVVIYRIQRAPERRVFYIDVGKMPPQRIKQYLEQIKNEIKQKKIPTFNGNNSEIEAVYNPQSQNEDFFLAQRSDGKGSRIETLPGGQNLGSIEDLDYFGDKVFRGLRIPLSYMKEGDTGGAVFNDGKLGQSYIVELRFSLYVQRLQASLERVMDEEFKSYLRSIGINFDNNTFKIKLPEPSNFGKYREQEMDAALLGMFGSADALPYLAKKFSMKRYLKLTDEEILENERMKLIEMGENPDNYDPSVLGKIYSPETMGMEGDMGGGMGDMGGGDLSAGDLMTPDGAGGEGEIAAGGGEDLGGL